MSSSDPESLVLTLLGTGCPIVDPNRLGPSALVRAGDQNLLVDCGSGVTQRLVQAGCSGRDIDALLLAELAEAKPSQAAARVAKATGKDRKELYARAMELK